MTADTGRARLPVKLPRDRIVRLRILATPGDVLLDRLLAFVTSAAMVPVDVEIACEGRNVAIEIVLDRACLTPSRWLLNQLEMFPSVRSADFIDWRHQSIVLEEAGVFHPAAASEESHLGARPRSAMRRERPGFNLRKETT